VSSFMSPLFYSESVMSSDSTDCHFLTLTFWKDEFERKLAELNSGEDTGFLCCCVQNGDFVCENILRKHFNFCIEKERKGTILLCSKLEFFRTLEELFESNIQLSFDHVLYHIFKRVQCKT